MTLPRSFLAAWLVTGKITGDIVNSLGEEWDAMKDDDSTTPFIGPALLGVRPKRTKR